MKATKQELINAFFIFLDDALTSFECEKIEREGNYHCHRCDICMMEQYVKKAKSGKLPKAATQNDGVDYPTIR